MIIKHILASFLLLCLTLFTPFIKANVMPDQHPNNVSFKEVITDDLPLLFTWFKEPHVKQWWPTPEENESFAKFLQRIRSKETRPYIVFIDEKPIGYIQYYHIDRSVEKAGTWLPELPETTVGTDQFIGDPQYLGKGYGTLFIKEFIKYLTHTLQPNITTIIVDPEPTNYAAIRCYEKVGFKPVGSYTTPWGPSLLMRYDIISTHQEKHES